MVKLIIKYLSLLLALIMLSACSGEVETELPEAAQNLENLTVYPADTEPAYDIQLTPEQTFGDTDTIFFDSIYRFEVDNMGRVFIPQDSILAFNTEGRYLSAVGNKGHGPGEFQAIRNLEIFKNNLFVYDLVSKRVTIIDLKTFNVIDDFNLSLIKERSPNSVFFIIDENTVIGQYEDLWQPDIHRYKYLFPININQDNLATENPILKQEIKNVFRKESGDRFQQGEFPFSRTTINALSSDNNIYSINTNNILIKVHDKNGQYLRSFYHPFERSIIDYETYFDFGNGVDLSRSDLPNFDFPETWPAVYSMVMDDQDRIWLSTIVENNKVYEWWVLSKEGKLLAQFRWPRNKEIKVVKNGKVYALEEDPETGVDSIVRYNFELN